MHGVVLFGHGARDARWKEPFERLAGKVCGLRGDRGPVSLAFLELMPPDLSSAIAEQVASGCGEITVVPVFLGQGGHVRRDLPDLVDQCRRLFPAVRISCATAVGEDDVVLDSIAAFCLRQVPRL